MSGDIVAISATFDAVRGDVALAVDDSGTGIPDGERVRVLQRFGRIGVADRERSGLGLAIVTAVAEAHGGSFDLAGSELGGCRCVVTLPRTRVLVDALTPAGV